MDSPQSITYSRRQWLQASAVGGAACWLGGRPTYAAESAAPGDLIKSVETSTIFRGRLGDDRKPLGKTWFSTRCGSISTPRGPAALMLMAEITGSDYFWPVHETLSYDGGRTWTEPTPVPGLGRTPLDDGSGLDLAVCDMVPEYHVPSGTTLAMGHDVFYRGKFFRPQPPRHAVYIVRAADGSWGPLRRFEWNDPRGAYIYTCNCGQRVTLPDGDVLVALSIGATENARSVVVVRTAFDGATLTPRATSNELKNKTGRGFLEPSLAAFGGRYWLTLRAEDNHGHVSVSDDGAEWSKPQVWQFDDGTPIAMSTTQQHWLVHRDALYLVYTRKDATNTDVMRWRAPLYAALVDPRTLRLVRATERIVVPLAGDGVRDGRHVPHLGNFHVNAATVDESWITVGQYTVADFRGDTTLTRVKWSTPNGDGPG